MSKKVIIEKSNRLFKMPPPLLPFSETERSRIFLRKSDVIDLATFNWPVVLAPDEVPDVEGLRPASRAAVASLKEELAAWLGKQFGCNIQPAKEIYVGGSVTTLMHQLSLALLDAGDVAFVPEVGVPLYRRAITAANAEAIGYELSSKTQWRPRFDRLSTRLGRVARVLFVNSPHNPTGVELGDREMSELGWLAGRENILVVNDCAYAGLPARKPVSLLSIKGGKRFGVEVYSFAYLLGLPAMPIGFVVGHADVIAALRPLSRLLPTQIAQYQVDMILRAMRHHPGRALETVRRGVAQSAAEAAKLIAALNLSGTSSGTIPYLWAQIEGRGLSTNLARQLYKRHRILITPGASFGENGEGFLRLSLTASADALAEATRRVSRRTLLKRKGTS